MTAPDLTALLATLRAGRIWDLSHELSSGMPTHPRHPSFVLTLMTRHGDTYREHGYSAANELIVMSGHHGTHVDALGHVSVDGKLHGGIDAFDAQRGTNGLKLNDAASLPPMLCRGVLIDVAKSRGVDELEPGSEVEVGEVESVLRANGTTVGEGDAVLFRTGWARRWHNRKDFYPPDGLQPGPGMEVAEWLRARRVRVVGSDTMVFECVSSPTQNSMPVHSTMLVEAGIPIIEMLQLEDLSRDGIGEFVFIALPLRIKGGTGSPIRPVAFA